MGKHLQKFMLQSDIETAVDDGTLVNPYIAIYGTNYEHIDWNTYVPVITFENGNIYTSSVTTRYGDIINSDLSEWGYDSLAPEISKVYFTGNLTPEMQAFVNNPRNNDLNRWHFLTASNTFSGVLPSIEIHNAVAIKYDSSNNVLMVIPDNDEQLSTNRGNGYGQVNNWINKEYQVTTYDYISDVRYNVLTFNLTSKEIYLDYFVGLENHNNKLIIGSHYIGTYSNGYSEIDSHAESLPSVILDYLDRYSNGTWNGKKTDISSYNISLKFARTSDGPYYDKTGNPSYGNINTSIIYDRNLMGDIQSYLKNRDVNNVIDEVESAIVQYIEVDASGNLVFMLSDDNFDTSTHYFEIDLSSFVVNFYNNSSDSDSDSGSGSGSGSGN